MSLVKVGYFNALEREPIACKEGLRKLQIPLSVHPLTLVKLSEVIYFCSKQRIKQGMIGSKLLSGNG